MDCGCGLQDGEGGKAGGGEVGRRPTSRDRPMGKAESARRKTREDPGARPIQQGLGAGLRARATGTAPSGSPIPVVETCQPAGCNRGSEQYDCRQFGCFDKSEERLKQLPHFEIDGFNCLVFRTDPYLKLGFKHLATGSRQALQNCIPVLLAGRNADHTTSQSCDWRRAARDLKAAGR